MLKTLACALGVAYVLLLAACGESTTTNNANTTNANNANRAANTSTASTNTATTTNTSAASGDKIGVAECDDFITKYDACVTGKVPEAARAQYKASIDQWRSSWRTLASNPQTKETLTQACKTAAEQARTSMKSFGCDF